MIYSFAKLIISMNFTFLEGNLLVLNALTNLSWILIHLILKAIIIDVCIKKKPWKNYKSKLLSFVYYTILSIIHYV